MTDEKKTPKGEGVPVATGIFMSEQLRKRLEEQAKQQDKTIREILEEYMRNLLEALRKENNNERD
jgi:hypothetical protein